MIGIIKVESNLDRAYSIVRDMEDETTAATNFCTGISMLSETIDNAQQSPAEMASYRRCAFET